MSNNPMIEEGRIKFGGLSSESFELPAIGDEVVYTVRGRVTSHLEREMADEGQRVTVTVKVIRVVEGVSQKVNEENEDQPSMFDQPEDQDDGQGEDQDEDLDAQNAPAAFVGPSFSGGE